MEKSITVKVTEEHIHEGDACSTGSCPIALAVIDMKVCMEVEVGTHSMTLDNVKYKLPQEAKNFIKLFDDDSTYRFVKPFEFIATMA